MKYDVRDFKFIFTTEGLKVEHSDGRECRASLVDRITVRAEMHKLVDDKPNTLWNDGHPEEPATKIYMVIDNNRPVIIEDFERLVFEVSRRPEIYEIIIEDDII